GEQVAGRGGLGDVARWGAAAGDDAVLDVAGRAAGWLVPDRPGYGPAQQRGASLWRAREPPWRRTPRAAASAPPMATAGRGGRTAGYPRSRPRSPRPARPDAGQREVAIKGGSSSRRYGGWVVPSSSSPDFQFAATAPRAALRAGATRKPLTRCPLTR